MQSKPLSNKTKQAHKKHEDKPDEVFILWIVRWQQGTRQKLAHRFAAGLKEYALGQAKRNIEKDYAEQELEVTMTKAFEVETWNAKLLKRAFVRYSEDVEFHDTHLMLDPRRDLEWLEDKLRDVEDQLFVAFEGLEDLFID